MTKNYTQLSWVQRYKIQSLWVAGMTQKFISNQLAVHPSTICRELDRNTAKRGRTSGHYVATNAQRKTDQRHQNKPKQVLFSLAMKQLIVKQLTEDKWSPELISAKGNEKGKYMGVLKRVNGKLISVRDIWNSDLPAAPTAK
jgi:IS30 family transposase